MQSSLRATLDFTASRSRRSAASRSQSEGGLPSRYVSLIYDVFFLWDMLVVASSEIIFSAKGQRWFDWSLDRDTRHILIATSLLGAMIAAALLRERPAVLTGRIKLLAVLVIALRRAFVASAALYVSASLIEAPALVPIQWAISWFVLVAGLFAGGRILLLGTLWAVRSRRKAKDCVAIIGAGPAADWLSKIVRRSHHYGRNGIDVIDNGPETLDAIIDDLLARSRQGEVDRVILALPETDDDLVASVADRLQVLEVEVASVHPLFSRSSVSLRTTQVAGVPLFLITPRPQYGWGELAKAVEDHVLAWLLILVMAPAFALISLAIRLDSPGPIIFRQRRFGVNGTEFEVFKFRTMVWEGAGAGSGKVQTRRGGDRRITRVGAILRKTSLDELPQLFNVVNNTMSLVGPRPHPVEMRTGQHLCDQVISRYPHRHRVKPGITGWAQVKGFRGATETVEQLRNRVECDLYYIENWSIGFDLRILLQTPVSMLLNRSNAF